MVTFKLEQNTMLTDKEKKMIAEARKLPVVYDEDSPEMTEQMEKAFIAARKAKPHRAS